MLNERKKLPSWWRFYLGDSSGQAVTEYILILGLVVFPIALAFNKLQNIVRNLLTGIEKLLYGPGI